MTPAADEQPPSLRSHQQNLKAGYRGLGGLPYEFRALEAALTSVSEALEVEMSIHRGVINRLVSNLESHIGE